MPHSSLQQESMVLLIIPASVFTVEIIEVNCSQTWLQLDFLSFGLGMFGSVKLSQRISCNTKEKFAIPVV
ncbi:Uncharacterised protein [Proteus vulgaris]|nr:Uncharacterised protein [Proteus vulgaris]